MKSAKKKVSPAQSAVRIQELERSASQDLMLDVNTDCKAQTTNLSQWAQVMTLTHWMQACEGHRFV